MKLFEIRLAEAGFDNKKRKVILEILDSVCSHCLDGDATKCCCMRDD